ncbi:hypothetical protein ACQRIT_003588 [Beauveria bassiana]
MRSQSPVAQMPSPVSQPLGSPPSKSRKKRSPYVAIACVYVQLLCLVMSPQLKPTTRQPPVKASSPAASLTL